MILTPLSVQQLLHRLEIIKNNDIADINFFPFYTHVHFFNLRGICIGESN